MTGFLSSPCPFFVCLTGFGDEIPGTLKFSHYFEMVFVGLNEDIIVLIHFCSILVPVSSSPADWIPFLLMPFLFNIRPADEIWGTLKFSHYFVMVFVGLNEGITLLLLLDCFCKEKPVQLLSTTGATWV